MKPTPQDTTLIDLSKLAFDAGSHTYTYDGTQIDNVTYVMRFLNVGMERVDPAVLAQAADRGTRVHEATLVYDMEGHIDCDPDIEGYVRAYAQFLRDYRIKEWRYYEKAVTDGKVAGTLDRFGMIGGIPTLLDIKTGIFRQPNHYVQLAAYGQLMLKCTEECPIDNMILSLKSNGKYTVHKPTGNQIYDALSIWCGCVYLNEQLKNYKAEKETKNGK